VLNTTGFNNQPLDQSPMIGGHRLAQVGAGKLILKQTAYQQKHQNSSFFTSGPNSANKSKPPTSNSLKSTNDKYHHSFTNSIHKDNTAPASTNINMQLTDIVP